MQAWQTQSLVTLGIAAFIVFRFVRRELRARVVRRRTLWIRPALLITILIFLVVETLQASAQAAGVLALALAFGALGGAVTGLLVVRSTTFSPANVPGAVRAHGSWVTAAIWIAAFALRLIARLFVPHSGVGTQLALNSGLVALVAVAFTVVAIAFYAAIGRAQAVRGVTA